MAGILYLCATPIGNLEDITLRVLRILKEADLIAAEDTRNSKRLLNAYDIKTPLTSYHEYNKYEKGPVLIDKLRDGLNIALITDAGTPGISDPGELLVQMAHEAGITVSSLPGACACVTALTMSGLGTRRFCFEAFLPADKKERASVLEALKSETRTVIVYEAPHHLKATLKELYEALGDRRLSICRELTKLHEEVYAASIGEALKFYEEHEPKGEFVLVIEGRKAEELRREDAAKWLEMPLDEHMQLYLKQGLDKKAAMKAVAKDRNVPKSEIYRQLIAD